ncbi:MAG: ester cyclase [Chlorobia bacterium]|nr:ester cyclase [Fimbriimonadaceae bacterium]
MPKRGEVYALVDSFFQEVWNEQNDDAIPKYISPKVIEHGLSGLQPLTLDYSDFIAFRARFLQAFPDAKFTVDNILVEGEVVVVRFHVEATHLGDGMGFPATGRKISFTAMGFGIWRDGKMIEAWNNFDQLGLMRQVGLIE